MGIYGRDYMRGESGGMPRLSGLSATAKLILANVILWFVFAGARSFGGPEGGLFAFIRNVLLFHPEEVFGKFRIWQPFTALFFHDPNGITHVLFNMLFLWVFGKPTEAMIGRRGFLQLYYVAGIASTLAWIPLSWIVPGPIVGLGASGAVYGVGVFLAIRRPQMPIYFFFVRMPLWVLVGVFMVGREVIGLMLHSGSIGSTTAHLAGALFGLLYERTYARHGPLPSLGIGDRLRRLRGPQQRPTRQAPAQPPFQAPPRRTEETQARVDALLDKISREGIGALSNEEKDFLEQASRRYGRR